MMAARAGRRSRRDAPALRFLLLCLGGWVAMRAMAAFSPMAPPLPAEIDNPWQVPLPFAAVADFSRPVAPTEYPAPGDKSRAEEGAPLPVMALSISDALPETMAGAKATPGWGPERHSLRLALMARLLPTLPGGAPRAAVPTGGARWSLVPLAAQTAPGSGKAFWMQRQMAGWTLGGWIFLRDGSGAASSGIAAESQLGGSQAGLRLAYGLGTTGRLRAYGRATIAVQQPSQRELAIGLAFAPSARWPVDFAVEQRVAAGSRGRTALAAMVSSGVGEVALPGGFRLEAYGQAGIVGARRRDGFADGAVVIDRRLGANDTAPFRLGAIAAGAAQPGAARVDVGPRLSLRLPDVGDGSRIALDWRQRVAGHARPASGLALTLATDF